MLIAAAVLILVLLALGAAGLALARRCGWRGADRWVQQEARRRRLLHARQPWQ